VRVVAEHEARGDAGMNNLPIPNVVQNYDELGQYDLDELAHVVRDEMQDARVAWSNALGHALNAGDALVAAQPKVTDLGITWKKWLKDNCCVAVSTAQLYMQLARHRDDIETEIQSKGELSLRGARQLIAKARDDEGEDHNQAGGQEDEGEAEDPSESVKPESLIEHWRRCPEQLADLLDEIGVPGVLEAMSAEFGRDLRARLPPPKRRSNKPFTKTLNLKANSARNARVAHSRQ
jgi:hypothetical protein